MATMINFLWYVLQVFIGAIIAFGIILLFNYLRGKDLKIKYNAWSIFKLAALYISIGIIIRYFK